TWLDRAAGIVQLRDGNRFVNAVVEGRGSEWFVTIGGRRLAVTARTWRERMLAEAEVEAHRIGGRLEVHASLPGLVVKVSVAEGSQVAEGDALLTIEAMKMQNEVRAPRSGVVSEVAVEPGQPVARGALLVRLA
ncbi:MAG TPA: acetyl-CoA carboxylase biotin carboxyl carrier protein subunit, partial [Candidatus Limnocylindria bacterium]